jgi:integrase
VVGWEPPVVECGFVVGGGGRLAAPVAWRVVGEEMSAPEGLLFHIDGRPVSQPMAAKYISVAAKRSGAAATWHDLRHHHASVLLAEGVNPSKVAERLGHDLKTLLETCAHVLPRDDDRVRAFVDASLAGSAEDWLMTEAS